MNEESGGGGGGGGEVEGNKNERKENRGKNRGGRFRGNSRGRGNWSGNKNSRGAHGSNGSQFQQNIPNPVPSSNGAFPDESVNQFHFNQAPHGYPYPPPNFGASNTGYHLQGNGIPLDFPVNYHQNGLPFNQDSHHRNGRPQDHRQSHINGSRSSNNERHQSNQYTSRSQRGHNRGRENNSRGFSQRNQKKRNEGDQDLRVSLENSLPSLAEESRSNSNERFSNNERQQRNHSKPLRGHNKADNRNRENSTRGVNQRKTKIRDERGEDNDQMSVDNLLSSLAQVTSSYNGSAHGIDKGKDENENKAKSAAKPRNKRRANNNNSQNVDLGLRAKLTEQCLRGTSECFICLDKVRQHQATWDCTNCYQIFHLGCIKKWAKSASVEQGWRCPGCQTVIETLPRDYKCFCRKVVNPEWNRNDGTVPHSCGEVCGKPLSSGACPHTCLDLCHPGPCDTCSATVNKTCPCGGTSKRVKCEVDLVCDQICEKLLNCGQHSCTRTCHQGNCDPCDILLTIGCYCGQSKREVICGPDTFPVTQFSCELICNKTLDCGNHTCKDPCHPGPCSPCPLNPEKVTHCPCGKISLVTLIEQGDATNRTSCTDPVATCKSTCDKLLSCGPPSSPHSCKSRCHTGPCPTCPLTTKVRCRCGGMDQVIPCSELTSRADDARCDRRCQKKRSCGRHKCGEACCIRVEHPCPIICNKLLSCKLHRCQETCHTGNCKTCHNVSFSELTCHCGASVIYPPVPCGTRPPECRELCRRQHSCDHQVTHTCHSEDTCPPCVTLTTKWCYGGHEQRKNVPCYVDGVSCGKPCGKQLKCGKHQCNRVCHDGPCVDVCTQPCMVAKPCGHCCGAPCHEGPCPDVSCSARVTVICECGRRQTTIACSDNSFSKLSTSLLASQMADIRAGNSVDLAELAKKSRKLDCNEECHKVARNARFAEALGLDNAELSSKIIPRYSEFMKDWFKRDQDFCSMVHTKLLELVNLSKESKHKSRSYSFPVMNRDKRQFVHEYSDHFGCESQSYDAEPKRNVVVTALKDKCSLPSISLQEAVARQKKAPTPLTEVSSESQPTFTTLTKSDNKIDWF